MCAGLQPWLVGLSRAVTWAIPWSRRSLPLWPCVPVTALKPLQAPVLLSSSPGPFSTGKVGSMPASLLGQKTPTGLPQGHWDPGVPPVISTLLPANPSPGSILRAGPSQGSCRGLLSQLLPFKGLDLHVDGCFGAYEPNIILICSAISPRHSSLESRWVEISPPQ